MRNEDLPPIYFRSVNALLVAIGLLLIASPATAQVDDDDLDEDEDGLEDLGEDIGTVSAWLLGLTLAYFAWKRLLPVARKELKDKQQKDRLKRLNSLNKKAIPVHTILGVAALVTGIAHGLMVGGGPLMLWVAVALMGILSVSGGLMRWRWPPREIKRGARLLHMQRLLSVAVVILLLVGHEMA